MSGIDLTDATRPNAGRIYDYLLGGHHNFEIDRRAAEQLIQLAPFAPKMARLQRWCLQDLAVELTEKRGFDVILDFASGLPTNDHIHYVVPEGTTVIYSDYDPVVVEYAREILADTPNVYFFQANAARPEELLNHPQVQNILGGRRSVALVYWGVTGFLTDDEITHAAQTLYEWAEEGSCWAFNAQGAGANPDDPGAARALEIYKQMGQPFHVRPLEQYLQLIRPWKPDEKGFIPLLEWHGLDDSTMDTRDIEQFGAAGGGYGAYLVK